MKRLIYVVLVLFSYTSLADQPGNAVERKPSEHQYKLIMSKDDKVCKHMLNLYNEDMKKYGYEKYDEHEEFNAIPWRETVKSVRQEGDKKIYRPMKAAFFDFNNDGKNELVIKSTTFLHGYDADSLYIFPDASAHLNEISIGELRDAPNKISPVGTCYELTQTKKAPTRYKELGDKQLSWCERITFLQPFIFDNVAYISFRGLHEKQPENQRKFLVVGKYKKGRLMNREPQTGVIEDICYFENVHITK